MARRFPSAAPGADGICIEASSLLRDDIEEEDDEDKDDDDSAADLAAVFLAASRSARDADDETALLLLLELDAALAAAAGDVGHMLPLLLLLVDDCGCGGEALSISAIVVMLRVWVAYLTDGPDYAPHASGEPDGTRGGKGWSWLLFLRSLLFHPFVGHVHKYWSDCVELSELFRRFSCLKSDKHMPLCQRVGIVKHHPSFPVELAHCRASLSCHVVM